MVCKAYILELVGSTRRKSTQTCQLCPFLPLNGSQGQLGMAGWLGMSHSQPGWHPHDAIHSSPSFLAWMQVCGLHSLWLCRNIPGYHVSGGRRRFSQLPSSAPRRLCASRGKAGVRVQQPHPRSGLCSECLRSWSHMSSPVLVVARVFEGPPSRATVGRIQEGGHYQ